MITGVLELLLKGIAHAIPDPVERGKLQIEMVKAQQAGQFKELEASMNVIVAEAKSEHPLTAQWRPITMLSFVCFIGAHWFGFTAENLSEQQVLELLQIVKIGLGGYVIGRSGEKIAKVLKEKEQHYM